MGCKWNKSHTCLPICRYSQDLDSSKSGNQPFYRYRISQFLLSSYLHKQENKLKSVLCFLCKCTLCHICNLLNIQADSYYHTAQWQFWSHLRKYPGRSKALSNFHRCKSIRHQVSHNCNLCIQCFFHCRIFHHQQQFHPHRSECIEKLSQRDQCIYILYLKHSSMNNLAYFRYHRLRRMLLSHHHMWLSKLISSQLPQHIYILERLCIDSILVGFHCRTFLSQP